MSFGLSNNASTFQGGMDYAFTGLIGKTIEIYQDDLIVFSKDGDSHIKHLKHVFERCREFGISLNPAKLVFGVIEGKILVYVISKDGVQIDSERVKSIAKNPFSSHKESSQIFLWNDKFC